MTTQREQSLALKSAEDFLKQILGDEDVPRKWREEAVAILRHYPRSAQIDLLIARATRAEVMPARHAESLEAEAG